MLSQDKKWKLPLMLFQVESLLVVLIVFPLLLGAQFSLLPPDNATGNFTKVVQRIPVKVVLDSKSIQGYESWITPGMSAKVSVAHR